MINDIEQDPLIQVLAGLPASRPGVARDREIRARCHATLARHHARAEATRSMPGVLADAALAVLLCGYAAIAILQAVRLIEAL
jgi:hypothetical protein